ncbi:sugar phosphate isomerase/epimerase [Eubacteriales bacterium OttesenSCG-928-A19]|nr:sugar phosphate isomerase/epimerase [Eubacteriales bacterium OttesenSCG-928-A19]
MAQFPIGVILDSFRKPLEESLNLAEWLGVQGIQVYATTGEMSPEMLVGERRAQFLRMVKDHGLVISALCGDLGHGFGDPEQNPALIDRSKRILEMAKELETDVVTTHIGVVPTSSDHPRYKVMQDACGELAAFADGLKAHFAIETGPETAATLKGFLDSLHSTGVAVNMDPANFVMVTGDDPVEAVYTLRDYIVHTHAKDGVKLLDRDPELIYGIRHEDALVTDEAFLEVPLGEGGVPFAAYLAALDAIGYKGFLTIEREVGDDPAGDIEKAVGFLKALM